MDQYEDKDRLERLKRGLYSRKAPDIINSERGEFSPNKAEAGAPTPSGAWAGAGERNKFDMLAARISHGAVKSHSLAKKLFSISLGIFAISVITALAIFFGGGNLISSKNVDIKVSGPISVGGGQEANFDISVVNSNNTDLEGAKLTIEYPKGVRKEGNLGEDITDESFNLGTIKSGKVANQTIKVFIFGEKDEVKEFKMTVDYNVKNSNGKFYKEKVYQVGISSSPIIVTATYPKEVNSNQDINFSIEIAPNSSDLPKELLLTVSYPFGFTVTSAEPKAFVGNSTWKFTNLKQGERQTINIYGRILGQDNEERVFKISAGTPNTDDPRQIGVPIVSLDESILVKKPFIGLNFKIEGRSGDFISAGSNTINSSLILQNNLPEKIFNVQVSAVFSGSAFSPKSVSAGQNGFFSSTNNTLAWDKRAIDKFSALNPGEISDMNFSVVPLNYQSVPRDSNPEINVLIKAEADRILESGETEHISSTESRTIKLSSDLSLAARLVRSGNGISNSGAIPPRVDNKTSYTVVWSISNSFNNVSNVSVRAILPPYVEWTGVKSPATENIIYNPDKHEVVWNAGTISSGTGFGSSPREAAFQISFLPSLSQIGREVELLGQSTINGIDKVTSAQLESTAQPRTSHFSDSSYHVDDEKVVQ